MTFLRAQKLKLSQHIFTCTDDQNRSTASAIVQLNSTVYTQQNYFNYTPTVSTTNDRITLPAGKYYLECALSVKRASSGTWNMEYSATYVINPTDSFTVPNYGGKSRLAIWRLE